MTCDPYYKTENGTLYKGDCLEVMDFLIEKGIKVDAIITDPPYAVTGYEWDQIIPFDQMWDKLLKLIKEDGAIVLFGNEPFSSNLRLSNSKLYRYDWKWVKTQITGFQNAKCQPLRCYEDVMVFSKTGTFLFIMSSHLRPKSSPLLKPALNKIVIAVLKNTTIFNINKEVIAIDKKLLDDPDFLKKYNIIEVISDSLVAITPKTEKSIRNIVIANRCFDLLQEYKQYQIDNGFKPTDKDYVFRTLDNLEVWNPNYLTKEWKYFVENNNLKKITVHDIRHSHATYLLSLGIPPQDVARRLGHSEPATTLKIYTHSNLIQDQKIVNIISQNEYYDIEKEHEKKDSYIFPMSILSILCNDKSNEEDLFATLDWFFNTSVEKEKIDLYLDVCKKYICDVNPQLNSFAEMIENLNENDKKILFGGINAIFNKNNELCLEQINDIDKYNIYDKKI